MMLNNFLVGSFINGIGLVIEFHLQSAFTEICFRGLIYYDLSIYVAL